MSKQTREWVRAALRDMAWLLGLGASAFWFIWAGTGDATWFVVGLLLAGLGLLLMMGGI